MGLIQVTVTLRVPGSENAGYEALFLVDTGATDSMAPGSELRNAGIEPVGKMSYELANGEVQEYPFGLAQIEFMGDVTAGRVIFGGAPTIVEGSRWWRLLTHGLPDFGVLVERLILSDLR